MKHILAMTVVVGMLGWGIPARAADEWKAPARAAKRKNPNGADPASLAAGAKVWAAECESCHGSKGQGDGIAVKDLDKKPQPLGALIAPQTDGELFWKLTEGRKPMPAFTKLSETDRWNAVNYMRSLLSKETAK